MRSISSTIAGTGGIPALRVVRNRFRSTNGG